MCNFEFFINDIIYVYSSATCFFHSAWFVRFAFVDGHFCCDVAFHLFICLPLRNLFFVCFSWSLSWIMLPCSSLVHFGACMEGLPKIYICIVKNDIAEWDQAQFLMLLDNAKLFSKKDENDFQYAYNSRNSVVSHIFFHTWFCQNFDSHQIGLWRLHFVVQCAFLTN